MFLAIAVVLMGWPRLSLGLVCPCGLCAFPKSLEERRVSLAMSVNREKCEVAGRMQVFIWGHSDLKRKHEGTAKVCRAGHKSTLGKLLIVHFFYSLVSGLVTKKLPPGLSHSDCAFILFMIN